MSACSRCEGGWVGRVWDARQQSRNEEVSVSFIHTAVEAAALSTAAARACASTLALDSVGASTGGELFCGARGTPSSPSPAVAARSTSPSLRSRTASAISPPGRSTSTAFRKTIGVMWRCVPPWWRRACAICVCRCCCNCCWAASSKRGGNKLRGTVLPPLASRRPSDAPLRYVKQQEQHTLRNMMATQRPKVTEAVRLPGEDDTGDAVTFIQFM